MVAAPDGTIRLLDEARPDLLLGVDAGAVRQDQVLTLQRGSTVLLYTDGLVERRDQLFDDGISQLREEFGAVAQEPVDRLVDRLLTRMVGDRAEDDVALVAVRLDVQDTAS